jgi:Holliday junction resolvasome RuvABC ATP-dependent DNA helicase subunit
MGTISQTFTRQLELFVGTHLPTRVLVGGLPPFVIEEMAKSWSIPTQLFLVCDATKVIPGLPANVRCCRPDDLTAERSDSWVALVDRSQSRDIQESVRSVGAGTVREVWQAGFPWHPCNLPGVRWSDVLKAWVNALGLAHQSDEICACATRFRDELRGEVDDSLRLFSALDGIAGTKVTYDDIAFAIGLPQHDPGTPLRKPNDPTAVLTCLDALFDRFKDNGPADTCAELKEAVVSLDPSVQPAAIAAIELLGSRYRALEPINSENPVRAWRECFAGNQAAWRALGHQVLLVLLGVEPQQLKIEGCVLESGPGADVITIGESRVVVRNTMNAAFKGKFTLNVPLAAKLPLKLFMKSASVATAMVPKGNIASGVGPHAINVPLRDKPKHAYTFWLGATSSDEFGKVKAPVIWECTQEYPLIMANARAIRLLPGRRRRARQDGNGIDYSVEQTITLPFQGRASIQGFIYDPNGLKWFTQAGESHEVTELAQLGTSKVKHFTLTVDVADGTTLSLTWTSDQEMKKHQATISFSVKGEPGPRSDSLSEALVDAHRSGRSSQLKSAIAEVKKPSPLRAEDLPIKPSTKAISRWESIQQSAIDGWCPFLVDDRAPLRTQVLSLQAGIHRSDQLRLNEQANAWKHAISAPPTAAPAEVTAYVTARTAVLAALASQFQGTNEETPLARCGFVGFLDESLLEAYFRAFTTMAETAGKDSFPAEWRWRARCLDTVLAFPAGGNAPSVALLGPFHPVSLARNHGLQRCLGERLASGKGTSFALLLWQAQPLFTGMVLGSQLEPTNAISFPTGDPCWILLHRQHGDSFLPQQALVNWLKLGGLDPVIGPLGVDPEVLPATLRQYSLAYPARRSLDILLEDCSQATFRVIRDDLAAGADGKRSIRDIIPGSLRIYAPNAGVTHLESETIAYDPDLPLLWHDAPPANREADIATLARSNQVHFATGNQHGAHSIAIPTVRRPLVRHSPNGLEVTPSLALSSPGSGLAAAIHAMIAAVETRGLALAWGSSLNLSEPLKARWTLCSAGQVDPRLFIDYVAKHPNTALWSYRLFNADPDGPAEFGRGHFLLARVSGALEAGLQALLTAARLPVKPSELLLTLAKAGLTLGEEFLRTGRAAEGALGQYLIERLVWHARTGQPPLPHSTRESDKAIASAGFILQVDPISNILDSLNLAHPAADESETRQRSDLVAFDVRFCEDGLWIHSTVIESKYIPSGQIDPAGAVSQAEVTANKLSRILETCIVHPSKPESAWWAQPERLLVADIIYLGLRLAAGSFSGSADEWASFETRVLTRVLSGDFNRTETGAIALIHYPGKTSNKLATGERYALVSLNDAQDNLGGASVPVYDDVRKDLTKLLRHDCSSSRRVALTPPSDPAPSTPTPSPQPAAVQPAPEAPVAPAAPGLQSNIARAHEKFDAAFVDFIGNRSAIAKLRDDIVDALIKAPPHLPSAYLLTGNPSTGKTTLANKVAKLLDVTFVKLVGTNIKNERDLIEQVDNAFKNSKKTVEIIKDGSQGIPEYIFPECLIFIDEIHLVKSSAQEGLLTLTEPKDRYVRLKDRICRFPKATYMAATTRDSEIDKALRTRFGNPIHLNDYKPAEVAEMLAVKNPTWKEWPDEVRVSLALLSRCVPREAERLAQKLERKMHVSRERLSVTEAQEKLRLEEGLDRNGLDRVFWKSLRALAKHDRPVGRDQLAQQLGLADHEKLVDEIIPTLQSRGLVIQVPGGQQITDRGRLYLRNEPAPSDD